MDGIYLLLIQSSGNLLRFEDGFLSFYREIIVGHKNYWCFWSFCLFRGVLLLCFTHFIHAKLLPSSKSAIMAVETEVMLKK